MGNIASNHFTETVISLTGPIVGLLSSTSSLIVIKVYLQDLHALMKNLKTDAKRTVLASKLAINEKSTIFVQFS